MGEIAAELDATASQVALAWLQTRPGVVLPIFGARTEEQLRDNLGAVDVELRPDQLTRLDELSAIPLGFPHEFTTRVRAGTSVLGDALERIDDHRAALREARG